MIFYIFILLLWNKTIINQYIYIYIYICSQGIVDELALFHAQSAWRFEGKKVRVAGLVAYCNYLFFFKKKTIYICRVSVFRPDPLQWICREWVQKLSSDGATACFGGEKYTESDGSTTQGERTPRPRMWTPHSSRILGASLLSLGFLFLLRPPLFFGRS